MHETTLNEGARATLVERAPAPYLVRLDSSGSWSVAGTR